MVNKQEQGKKNRRTGQRFEEKVRKNLESQGFIVSKWQNNVDLKKGIVPAKGNRFGARTLGFPDFIVFMKASSQKRARYRVMLIEAKTRGYLDKEEKEKMQFLTELGIECWIAYDDKETGKVAYRTFVEYSKSSKVRRSKIRS